MRTTWAMGLAALVAVGWAAGVRAQQPSGPGSQPDAAQVVLSTMHQYNELAMALGRMAEQKGVSVDVRRCGARLLQDHRYGDRMLQKLARLQGLTLLPVAGLPSSSKLEGLRARAGELRQASGSDFDGLFLELAVSLHQAATDLQSDAVARLAPGPVRRLVSRLLPIVRQDLSLARDLRDGMLGG